MHPAASKDVIVERRRTKRARAHRSAPLTLKRVSRFPVPNDVAALDRAKAREYELEILIFCGLV